MKVFKILDKSLLRIEEFVLSYSVIVMSIILIINVISRTIFNNSITFAEEAGKFLTIIITFMGISYVARKGRHIHMSALFDMLPEKLKKIFMLGISFLTSLILFYLAYLGTLFTLKVYAMGRVTPALMVPMWIIDVFVPLGFFLGGLQYLLIFVANLKNKEIFIGTEKLDKTCEDEACKSAF